MIRESQSDKDDQKRLEKRDKFNRAERRVFYWYSIVLGIGAVVFVVGAYIVNDVRGTATSQQFITCCMVVLGTAVVVLTVRLVNFWEKQVFSRDITLDPATMELPAKGTVTLNGALHKLTMPVGAIVWTVIWGCIFFSMLFMLGDDAHRAAILRSLTVVAVLMVGGYPLFCLFWKKKSFVKKMIKNSAQFFQTEVHEGYADSVDASLQYGILAYERELILTDDYLLGTLGTGEWDTSYAPVAVPRAKITSYVFHYRRMVNGRYSRTIGILTCQTMEGTEINIMLGQVPKAQKVLRILDYYQIPWTEKTITYA